MLPPCVECLCQASVDEAGKSVSAYVGHMPLRWPMRAPLCGWGRSDRLYVTSDLSLTKGGARVRSLPLQVCCHILGLRASALGIATDLQVDNDAARGHLLYAKALRREPGGG